MIIAHTNDLHYRNERKQIERLHILFQEMAAAKPDVITIAGDFTGDHRDSMRLIFEIMRIYWDGPVVACKGNHDYWVHIAVKDQKTMTAEFEHQMRECLQACEDHNVHLLEEHGVWSHPDHFGICILGHGGWYFRDHHKTTDYDYMPRKYQGKWVGTWINDLAEETVRNQIATLTDEDWTRVAMTHMPVNECGIGEYHHFGEQTLGDMLTAAGCKKFLHGHMHHKETGPHRYESGSNGFFPQFIIVPVV